MDAERVHAVPAAGLVHAAEIGDVVDGGDAVVHAGWREPAGHDDHAAVLRLDGPVCRAQHSHIARSVQRLPAPFVHKVLFIPDLDARDPTAVARRHGASEIGQVLRIGWRTLERAIGVARARPVRCLADGDKKAQAPSLHRVHQAVQVVPHVLPLAGALELLPGYLNLHPAEAGTAGGIEGLGNVCAEPWLNLKAVAEPGSGTRRQRRGRTRRWRRWRVAARRTWYP